MTSLSEVYTPDAEFHTSLRRLYAGLGLFGFGVLLVVVSIVVDTTGLIDSLTEARQLAGILAGIGVPAVFLGIFSILPSSRTTQVAAGIGAALSLLGVALFAYAYPCQWSGTNCLGPTQSLLTLPVALIYFIGAGATLWCLFTGIANFKARNNPGGTARVEVSAQGETRVIEVPKSELSKFSGSMGVLGDPAEDVEAPDRPGARSADTDDGSSVFQNDERGAVSDGGSSSSTLTDVSDDVLVQGAGNSESSSPPQPNTPSGPSSPSGPPTHRGPADPSPSSGNGSPDEPNEPEGVQSGKVDSVQPSAKSRPQPGNSARRDDDWEPSGKAPQNRANSGPDRDSYCGSCVHFDYIQSERGMQPYCGAHDEVMDDMEACDDYTPRTK